MEVKFNRDSEKWLWPQTTESPVHPLGGLSCLRGTVMPRKTETPNWWLGVLHSYSAPSPDFLIAKALKRPVSTRVHSHSFMGPDGHQAFAHRGTSATTTVSHHIWAHLAKRRHVDGPEAMGSCFRQLGGWEGPGQPYGMLPGGSPGAGEGQCHTDSSCGVHRGKGEIAGIQEAKI